MVDLNNLLDFWLEYKHIARTFLGVFLTFFVVGENPWVLVYCVCLLWQFMYAMSYFLVIACYLQTGTVASMTLLLCICI